jgi:hypothetical protein
MNWQRIVGTHIESCTVVSTPYHSIQHETRNNKEKFYLTTQMLMSLATDLEGVQENSI